MDEFERELQQAMERKPAPPFLKSRVMARRQAKPEPRWHLHQLAWQRLAASVALAAVLGGALAWRHAELQHRKGVEARQQVLTALRITGRALDQMNQQLTAHGSADRE